MNQAQTNPNTIQNIPLPEWIRPCGPEFKRTVTIVFDNIKQALSRYKQQLTRDQALAIAKAEFNGYRGEWNWQTHDELWEYLYRYLCFHSEYAKGE